MKKTFLVFIITILALLSACKPANVSEVSDAVVLASGATLQSEKTRIKLSEVSESDQNYLTDGNGAFAFDLYQKLKTSEGNLFYSPYSISAALAMTYAGAGSTTAERMATALHFDLPQEKLPPAFNWLDSELVKRGEGAEGKDDEGFRLNVVNAIWGQKGYGFKVAFLDTLAENYGAGLQILDFIGNPEESRLTINDWVSDQTGKRIQDLLVPRSITTDTRLVLTNAIYFKAAWYHKFMEEDTTNLPFYLLDGSSVTIPMMKQTMVFHHADGDNYQAVELPYQGNEISMLVIVPDEGKFAEFEDSLDYQKMSDIIAGLEDGNINLTMPKFQFESGFSLKEPLSALGMGDAFSPDTADFSGMTDSEELWLDDVTHKAYVSVDESGTEASAATAAVIVVSIPGTITIDRPFIFLIRDIKTGTILFVGRILNPEA